MKCQICNRETDNFKKNKQTGKYESICNVCQNIIRGTDAVYQDFEEDILDVEVAEKDFLEFLKELEHDK